MADAFILKNSSTWNCCLLSWLSAVLVPNQPKPFRSAAVFQTPTERLPIALLQGALQHTQDSLVVVTRVVGLRRAHPAPACEASAHYHRAEERKQGTVACACS